MRLSKCKRNTKLVAESSAAAAQRSGHLASAAGGMVHICEFRIPMPMTVWALGLPPRTRSLVLARALALALLLGA